MNNLKKITQNTYGAHCQITRNFKDPTTKNI